MPLSCILLNYECPKRIRTLKPDAIPTLQMNDKDKNNRLSKDDEVISQIEHSSKEADCNKAHAIEVAGTSIVFEKSDKNIKPFPRTNITPGDIAATSPIAIEKSDKNITVPRTEYKLLKRTINQYDILKRNLEKIFTHGQIRCLMKPDMRRVTWSAEDIAAAISFRSQLSPKAYSYLRTTIGIPLPSFSTLRKWASNPSKVQIWVEK